MSLSLDTPGTFPGREIHAPLFIVPVPGLGVIAISADALRAGLADARAYLGLSVQPEPTVPPVPLLTDEQMAELTGTPSSWWGEAARTGRVPSISIGKYRRFEYEAVLEHLRRHAD